MCLICLVEPGNAVAEVPGGIGKYKKLERDKKRPILHDLFKPFPQCLSWKVTLNAEWKILFS